MVNSCPTFSKSGFDNRLASINCCVVTPNFSAIALSVSPGSTTYFCPAVEGGADALGAGGRPLDDGTGGALLAGAELLAGALGTAERLELGVAARDELGVAAFPVGVTVALSRVQAPSNSAPHITPAATPRLKR
jgi:hypothetical protein